MGSSTQPTKITTLGITATIMILYNMIAWPYIHELTQKRTPIDKLMSETHRAWAIVHQVDVVVDFVTTITSFVKNLSTSDAEKETQYGQQQEEEKEQEDFIMKLYDEDQNLLRAARLRETKKDENLYSEQLDNECRKINIGLQPEFKSVKIDNEFLSKLEK